MKTVRDAGSLQPNALSIKLIDPIEPLDELIHAEGDGSALFAKTFITQGLRELVTDGVAELTGVSTQAIFHLKQAMRATRTISSTDSDSKPCVWIRPVPAASCAS